MENKPSESRYKWYLLFLGMVTNALVSAAPMMCLSVLFSEISADLNLTLVQVGFVWGISALPGIVTVLIGGAVGDRFGPRRVLVFACAMVGITGALRGVSGSYEMLIASVLLFGVFMPFITMNVLKACGTWFPGSQLGLASGVLSMGMALGFLLSSMFSATLLSPMLGGWRNVLYFYGAIAIVLAVPWYFTRSAPGVTVLTSAAPGGGSTLQNLAHVARLRNVWLFGMVIFGINGCIQGSLGYLPLHLRGLGWPDASADGALATFHLISMLAVIPIALLSDRLGTRKKVLIAAAMMIALGIGALSFANGWMVWGAVITAGMVRDGFMAVFLTALLETKGVGTTYAGTATGLVMVFSGLSGLIAPPVGNGLAGIAAGAPFLFWAALTVFGFAGLLLSDERSVLPVAAVAD